LKGVSLIAERHEAVGLVGLNGSGKSTLLRVIAGLEAPQRGTVAARSNPILLGVSAALVGGLSGRENVRLGCLAMGMKPDQAAQALPDIMELSGIGSAINRPMNTYSSGMGARLRFAIAAAARPEILLIDEALSTGDAAFKERSQERMAELRAEAGCVFLVSHAAQTIEEMCTRAIWLHNGHVILNGPAPEVARTYRWYAWNIAKGESDKARTVLRDAYFSGTDLQIAFQTQQRQP
ncbi:MAG: ABC transporter ATP-binding protein, partial [Propioniciclava sp.]